MSAIKNYSTYVASIALLAIFQMAATDPVRAENDVPGNALLRYFDQFSDQGSVAGIAGLTMDSTGSVYFAGGFGRYTEYQGVLRKFDQNGQVLWEKLNETFGSFYRQVVVDAEDQVYLSFEFRDGIKNAGVEKRTPEGRVLWTTEIAPPVELPELQIQFGSPLRIAADNYGVLVAVQFLAFYDSGGSQKALYLSSVVRLSHEGAIEWRTNFWPELEGQNPWPRSSNDIWLDGFGANPDGEDPIPGFTRTGALVRTIVPDGYGGVFLVGDMREELRDGFYFHLDDQGRTQKSVLSLNDALEEAGLIAPDAAGEFGLEPIWLVRGPPGIFYVSGRSRSPPYASFLLAISELGQPLWLSGIPCESGGVDGDDSCGSGALLHPKVLPDGSLVLLEMLERLNDDPSNPVGSRDVNLVHYSPSGELLSTSTVAAPRGLRSLSLGGFVANKKMFWVSGQLAEFTFDDGYLSVSTSGTFVLRCPTAVLRSQQGCPIIVE